MPTQLTSSLASASCPALEDLALRDFGVEERQALANAGSSVLMPNHGGLSRGVDNPFAPVNPLLT